MTPRITRTAAVAAVVALSLTACAPQADQGGGDKDAKQLVCIDQYATATAISDVLTGIDEALADAKKDGLEVIVKNPQADVGTEQTIAQQFITSGCDVVVAIGTAAAQLHANLNKESIIVFSGSSTPVEAGIIDSMEKPGGNVTGVADVIDPSPDIDAMVELMPKLDTVGLIWKLGDPAGDAQTAMAKEHLDALGIRYIEATITNGSEITQAAQSLANRVDAIQIPGDTTTLSAAAGVIAVADSAGIPVFGGTSAVVEVGGVLSSSYEYVGVGRSTGEMVLKMLAGADPATTPVIVPDTMGLDLNTTQLEKLGITVPDALLDRALSTR